MVTSVFYYPCSVLKGYKKVGVTFPRAVVHMHPLGSRGWTERCRRPLAAASFSEPALTLSSLFHMNIMKH